MPFERETARPSAWSSPHRIHLTSSHSRRRNATGSRQRCPTKGAPRRGMTRFPAGIQRRARNPALASRLPSRVLRCDPATQQSDPCARWLRCGALPWCSASPAAPWRAAATAAASPTSTLAAARRRRVGAGVDQGTPDASAGTGGAIGPPEQELDSTYQAPVLDRAVHLDREPDQRPRRLRRRHVAGGEDGRGRQRAHDGRRGPRPPDEVVVLNVLSNDATVLRTDGTTLTSRTIPGIVAGANRLVGLAARALRDRVGRRAPGRERARDRGIPDADRARPGRNRSRRRRTPRSRSAFGRCRSRSPATSGAPSPSPRTASRSSRSTARPGRAWPTTSRSTPIPTATADTRDVSITADGRFAVVRREGSSSIGVADLASGALTTLALSGPVTDLDVTDDGARAVAVVRQTVGGRGDPARRHRSRGRRRDPPDDHGRDHRPDGADRGRRHRGPVLERGRVGADHRAVAGGVAADLAHAAGPRAGPVGDRDRRRQGRGGVAPGGQQRHCGQR